VAAAGSANLYNLGLPKGQLTVTLSPTESTAIAKRALAVGSELQVRRIRAEAKRCCRCMAAPQAAMGVPGFPLPLSRRDERLWSAPVDV
jgi:hypothetical protein